MALVNCKECGKEVSDKAASCPHCGISAPGLEVQMQENTGKFVNPANGRVEEIPGMVFIGSLMFGPLFYLLRGIWPHGVGFLLLTAILFYIGGGAILVLAIVWLLYAISAREIIRNDMMRRGWIEVA